MALIFTPRGSFWPSKGERIGKERSQREEIMPEIPQPTFPFYSLLIFSCLTSALPCSIQDASMKISPCLYPTFLSPVSYCWPHLVKRNPSCSQLSSYLSQIPQTWTVLEINSSIKQTRENIPTPKPPPHNDHPDRFHFNPMTSCRVFCVFFASSQPMFFLGVLSKYSVPSFCVNF